MGLLLVEDSKRVVWTVHIPCKNIKELFRKKKLYFQRSSVVYRKFSGVRHALKLEVCISGLLCEIRQTEVQVHAPYLIKYSVCVHGIYLGLLS
jgi:hypothetical protein